MPKRLPLQGLRVLITRPEDRAAGLGRDLERLGARVLRVPTIRIAPPRRWGAFDAALRRLDRYDWILFTSAQGVDSFFARRRRLGLRSALTSIGVIGPATGAAVRAHGGRVARMAGEHHGEGLAAALGRVRGRRILLAAAERARPELPLLLRQAGARVEQVVAYRTLPAREAGPRLRRLARQGGIDLVLFTSPSTALSLQGILGRTGFRRLFERARAASIGPVTSAALRRLGIGPAVEARPHTAKGLVRALTLVPHPPFGHPLPAPPEEGEA